MFHRSLATSLADGTHPPRFEVRHSGPNYMDREEGFVSVESVLYCVASVYFRVSTGEPSRWYAATARASRPARP